MKKAIEEIRDVLMHAEAISCWPSAVDPICYASNQLYEIPSSYQIKIDFNKLAQAIYDGGYRKHEQKD